MLAKDKLIHCFGSALVVFILCHFMTMRLAFGITIGLGIIKEIVYDKWMGKGTPEWEDFIADLIGVGLGGIFYAA